MKMKWDIHVPYSKCSSLLGQTGLSNWVQVVKQLVSISYLVAFFNQSTKFYLYRSKSQLASEGFVICI